MISKQAQDFWTLLKSYPKQIEMPLAQAREADLKAEDFTSEPKGVTFSPAAEVDRLWAEPPNAARGRSILYFFGGGFALGTPATRRKTQVIWRWLRTHGCSFRTIAWRRSIRSRRRSMMPYVPTNSCSIMVPNLPKLRLL
jgi:acetyl esterase/lipase